MIEAMGYFQIKPFLLKTAFYGDGKMAHPVKALAAKADDLSSIFRTYVKSLMQSSFLIIIIINDDDYNNLHLICT